MGNQRKKGSIYPFENKPIRIERKMQKSKALWSLRNHGLAILYVLEFMARRQMHHINATREWVIRNNGEIVFTYAEAEKNFGVSPSTHLRTLKKIHEVGFIDVAHYGGGMEGDCNKFSISKRWKQFGTPDFKKKEWPKDTRKKGNPKISQYGNGRKK